MSAPITNTTESQSPGEEIPADKILATQDAFNTNLNFIDVIPDIKVKNCNINLEELKTEVGDLFKNPNPIALYMNSSKIRDKFTDFVNCLSDTIVSGFSLDDNQGITYAIYKNAKYDDVWSQFLKNYLYEFKYFDFLTYLNFVVISDNNKNLLAKALLKLYKREKQENISKFLELFKSKYDLEQVKDYAEYFKIKDYEIEFRYTDEDKVNYFLQELYFNLDITQREVFRELFSLNPKEFDPNFTRTVKIVGLVMDDYPYKQDSIYEYVNKPENSSLKSEVDQAINGYSLDKRAFYENLYKIIHGELQVEKKIFWKYVKIEIINRHYPDIKNLFYFYSAKKFVNKEIFNTFKGTIDYNKIDNDFKTGILKSNHYAQIQQLKELKNLLLELNNNIFSFFLNPMVYSIISERLRIQEKDLWKLEYLLYYIFADNYSEYKHLYMFFNQLEAFMNASGKVSVLEKIKVSFSLVLLTSLVITFSYFYLPIGVFIGLLFLSMIKGFEFYYPDLYFRGKTNLGLKFFATLILIMSSYFWLTSADTDSKRDLAHAIEQIRQVGVMPSDQAMQASVNYVKASLFDIKK
ncbi:MAG: hypothetical protein PHG82_02580 [Candidatus Gracilibacteria bacterium]|nr:hypothetical protein [Candidatus Gracilibacteria bacterium]